MILFGHPPGVEVGEVEHGGVLKQTVEPNLLALGLALELLQRLGAQLQHKGTRLLLGSFLEPGHTQRHPLAAELRRVVAAGQRQQLIELEALRTRVIIERAPAELVEGERDFKPNGHTRRAPVYG